MSNPHCPVCHRNFKYIDSFKFWHPTKPKCFACAAPLEGNRVYKLSSLVAFIFSAIAATFTIYMEDSGIWQPAHSYLFVAGLLIVVLTAYKVAWRHIEFFELTKT